jgi:hypothetical protein
MQSLWVKHRDIQLFIIQYLMSVCAQSRFYYVISIVLFGGSLIPTLKKQLTGKCQGPWKTMNYPGMSNRLGIESSEFMLALPPMFDQYSQSQLPTDALPWKPCAHTKFMKCKYPQPHPFGPCSSICFFSLFLIQYRFHLLPTHTCEKSWTLLTSLYFLNVSSHLYFYSYYSYSTTGWLCQILNWTSQLPASAFHSWPPFHPTMPSSMWTWSIHFLADNYQVATIAKSSQVHLVFKSFNIQILSMCSHCPLFISCPETPLCCHSLVAFIYLYPCLSKSL